MYMCVYVYKSHLVHCFFSSGQHSVTQLYLDKNVKHTLAFSNRVRAVNSQAAILSPSSCSPSNQLLTSINWILSQSGNQREAFFKVSKVWTQSNNNNQEVCYSSTDPFLASSFKNQHKTWQDAAGKIFKWHVILFSHLWMPCKKSSVKNQLWMKCLSSLEGTRLLVVKGAVKLFQSFL